MDYSIFYISHFVEPYLAFCLTQSYFFSILIVVLWELLEYGIYSTTGNYSILFLETENSVMESLDDILLYDIGGGILSVYIGFSLYSIYQVTDTIVKFELSEWKMFLLYFVKVILLSPFLAIGWECNESSSTIVSSLCPDESEYQSFPWGLLAYIPINVGYIVYMFQEKPSQLYIAISFPIVIILTAFQMQIHGVILSMWILVGVSAILTIYWLYKFVEKRVAYRPV